MICDSLYLTRCEGSHFRFVPPKIVCDHLACRGTGCWLLQKISMLFKITVAKRFAAFQQSSRSSLFDAVRVVGYSDGKRRFVGFGKKLKNRNHFNIAEPTAIILMKPA